MISAISTSLSGLQSATQQLNVAAENIVKSSSFSPSPPVSGAQEINQTAQSGGPVRANFSPLPDFESSLVDLQLAEVSYKASAQALKVALDAEKNLIDQLG